MHLVFTFLLDTDLMTYNLCKEPLMDGLGVKHAN